LYGKSGKFLPNDILTVPRGSKTTNECPWHEQKQQQQQKEKYITLQNGREVEENCTANNRPKKKEKCTKCEWKLAEKCHQQQQPGKITKKK